MAAPTYALTWEQGDDAEITLIYKEGDPVAPADLSAAQARMDISDKNGRLIFSLNSVDFTDTVNSPALDNPGSADNEITLGADGSIYVLLPRAVTISGVLSTHINEPLTYDLFLRRSNNLQKKILQGTIMIMRSETKWL